MKIPSIISQTAGVVIVVIAGLAVIHVLGISYPVRVISTMQSTELSVVGEGKVDVVPDTAIVDVGVYVDSAKTAEEVEKTISAKSTAVIAAIKAMGVDAKDIQTLNLYTNPNYSYESGRNVLNGYNGSISINVKVRDTAKAQEVVSTATKAGANQILGTRFIVDKPEKYREQARETAIQNAKDQAEKIAKSLNIRLGKVVNVVESTPGDGGFTPYMRAEGLGGGGGNMEPGTETITSTVTLYFEKQ